MTDLEASKLSLQREVLRVLKRTCGSCDSSYDDNKTPPPPPIHAQRDK